MDSITQAVLGGTIAVAVTRGKEPRKAVMWGAIIATLPDLDVLIQYDNPLDRIVAHRTWTHSWFVHTAITPVLATLLHRTVGHWNVGTWWLLVWLALTTHSGIDACTVFGTDLFWPFADSTVIGGSVFIIDPAYTIFLLLACIFALWRPLSTRLWHFSVFALVFSSAYLAFGMMAKSMIYTQAIDDLAKQGIKTEQVLVQATPFNTLLWRIIVIDGESYYEGYHSILDAANLKITAKEYPRKHSLLTGLENTKPVKQLEHFNHGYYSVKQDGLSIIVSDLRMGAEPAYNFQFKIAEKDQADTQLTIPKMMPRPGIPDGLFSKIWQRIFDENAKIDL